MIVRSLLADRVLDTFAEQATRACCSRMKPQAETLPPREYAFWQNMAKVILVPVDRRHYRRWTSVAVEIARLADKVTLRLNAVATYRNGRLQGP